MKDKILLAIALLCLTIFSSCKEEIKEDFDPPPAEQVYYYYKGEKVFLTQRIDKIYITFVPNTTKEQFFSIINNNIVEELIIDAFFHEDFVYDAVIETKDGKYISSAIINYFKSKTEVVSVNYFLGDKGNLAVTDEFSVQLLNDSTSLEQLHKLNKQYNCTIKRKSQVRENHYMLSVPKTSKLSVFDMANLYYETGYFLSSSPNFLQFDAFGSNDPYSLLIDGLEVDTKKIIITDLEKYYER